MKDPFLTNASDPSVPETRSGRAITSFFACPLEGSSDLVLRKGDLVRVVDGFHGKCICQSTCGNRFIVSDALLAQVTKRVQITCCDCGHVYESGPEQLRLIQRKDVFGV